MRHLKRSRVVAILVAGALSVSVVGAAQASWSGTQVTINPTSGTFWLESHERYQASSGTIELTLTNGVDRGIYIALFNPNGAQYTNADLWGNQATGAQYFRWVANNSTTIPGPAYWYPAHMIYSNCTLSCDLTFGGWYDYQGNDNPG